MVFVELLLISEMQVNVVSYEKRIISKLLHHRLLYYFKFAYHLKR